MTRTSKAAQTVKANKADEVPEGFAGETESTEVATTASNANLATMSAGRFRIAKRVTLPTLNPGVNKPLILRIEDAFRVSDYVNPDPKKANEKPATVCTVTELDTGVVSLWLVAEVAHKNIEAMYPDKDYIGRIFGIQKLPKRPGKRYFDFEVVELEDNEAQ